MAAIISTVLLVCYILLSYFFFGPTQSALVQRLLGAGCALLTLLCYLFYTRREEPTEALLLRHRLAQESDFGKELLAEQIKSPLAITLPGVGKVSVRMLGSLAVVGLTAAWWVTPLSPVRVAEPPLNDLTIPFGEQIAAAVLLAPDGHTAVLQQPLLPVTAKILAQPIRDKADVYHRGIKAMAEGQYDKARTAFLTAANQQTADAALINLARAQNEMFAGMFVDAIPYYNAYLREHPDDALVLLQNAVALLHMGMFRNAEPFIERASQIDGKQAKTEHTLGLVLNLQAILLMQYGRQYDQAEACCARARDALDKTPDNVSLLATCFNNQAVLSLVKSKYLAAINLFNEARYRWGQTYGQQNLLVATCMCNQAALQTILAGYPRASDLLASARTIQHGQVKREHPLVAYRLVTEAALARARANYGAARASAEDALSIIDKNFSQAYAGNLPPLNLLAAILCDAGQFDDAEAYDRVALTLAKSIYGAQHPVCADILYQEARLQLAKKRYTDCDAACRQSRTIYERAFGKEHAGVASVLCVLGQLEIARDHPRTARPYLEQALKIRENVFGKDHPRIACVMGAIALADNDPESRAQGLDLFEQAIAMDKVYFGSEHPEIARLLQGSATLAAAQGDYQEAAAELKQAIQMQEMFLTPSHPELLASLTAYAEVLRKEEPPNTQQADLVDSKIKSLREQYVYP